ncbi:PTS system mannose-specific EIIBCA component [Caulifigura coniformis]|uniref:PTS system mannose-specific EIIBCA component n=1 Tax=Caulifigura coniformis TaxID=2527983 RepID=A0A517SK69_9PLAN|nr:PTS sugar transporter subunit IIA [Caulifigura coniformis]QDT56523.1 PTS system mannose-specific EIIBCA component [Caulifigura coniformis]
MKLSDFIVADAVIPELKASTKEEAIREMVASLVKTGHVSTEHEPTIVGAIMKREELGSTGIGRGVAVPHTKHASVGSLIATVAISANGLDFSSLDGEDVYILFLLVSPPDRPGDHLRGLETITRHLKSDDFCRFLRQSRTREAIVDLLKEVDSHA